MHCLECPNMLECQKNGGCARGQAAQETVQAGSVVRSEGPKEALPPEGAARGAAAGQMAMFAARRLCKTCTHQERSLTLPPGLKNCAHASLPINLVTGQRVFPCIIARGYDALCGPLGQYWEFKGHR